MIRRAAALVVFVLLLGAPVVSRAGAPLPPILKQVTFEQRLDETVPLDTPFHDDEGHAVKLGDYFGAQPVVLVMAYFRCPMLCTQVLNGLVEGLRESGLTIGKDFRVVTISFDPSESPRMAAAKKASYVRAYADPRAEADWHFLTGSKESIDRVAQAIGFRYAYDEASDQYAHAAGIVVLTPQGKISRYFYDVHYPGRDLRLGLVEASQNRIGTAIDQVLLFCFHYDPTAGRYGAAVMNFVRAGGVLTVIVLAAFFAAMMRGERRRRGVLTAAVRGAPVNGELTG